jgi:hypothetical protein
MHIPAGYGNKDSKQVKADQAWAIEAGWVTYAQKPCLG